MAVNLTVGQAQSAFQASTVTQPIVSFLGTHVASVTLNSTMPGTGNQVSSALTPLCAQGSSLW